MHPAKGDYQPPELFLRNVVIFRKYQAGRLFYAAPLGGGSDAIRFASWIPTASSTRPATTAADCSGRLRSKLHEDLSAGEYWVVVDTATSGSTKHAWGSTKHAWWRTEPTKCPTTDPVKSP